MAKQRRDARFRAPISPGLAEEWRLCDWEALPLMEHLASAGRFAECRAVDRLNGGFGLGISYFARVVGREPTPREERKALTLVPGLKRARHRGPDPADAPRRRGRPGVRTVLRARASRARQLPGVADRSPPACRRAAHVSAAVAAATAPGNASQPGRGLAASVNVVRQNVPQLGRKRGPRAAPPAATTAQQNLNHQVADPRYGGCLDREAADDRTETGRCRSAGPLFEQVLRLSIEGTKRHKTLALIAAFADAGQDRPTLPNSPSASSSNHARSGR